jgi:hypothetical protein
MSKKNESEKNEDDGILSIVINVGIAGIGIVGGVIEGVADALGSVFNQ